MGKINVLSKAAAEKIAAGEVVERPANAIKEMIENSIDAGASSVIVEIRRGGVAYIRVTDNGSGILSDDVEKAFMRHATSKIKNESDLEHISTLGFRGEALCSIAAVSRTEMITKPPACELGRRIRVEGGEIVADEEAGCPDGTTITVRDLFYNTPARMKFLKKDSAEAALVTDVCQKQALGCPRLSLRLIRDGREVFFTPGNNNLSDAVRSLWGKDISQSMSEVAYQSGGIKVWGLAGKNSLSRPSRSMQVFFVNGRYVVNRTLALALSEAYKNELMGGRFPVAVLNIEINPALCDVNVHPTKTEIKFADEQSVYDAVYWAVKNMLGTQAGAREVQASFISRGVAFKMPPPTDTPRQLEVKPVRASKFKAYEVPPKETAVPANESAVSTEERKKQYADVTLKSELYPFLPKKEVERLSDEWQEKLRKGEVRAPIIHKAHILPKMDSLMPQSNDETEALPPKTEVEEAEESNDINVKIIGQLFSTYILAEGDGELLLIDQHAAHERIRYEEIKANEGKCAPQMLIVPVNVALSPNEINAARENNEFLRDMGFDFDELDENTVMLRSVPSDCEAFEGEMLFMEVVGTLLGNEKGEIGQKRDRAMYTVACRSAVKGNSELSEAETEALVKQALSLDGISTCPHGRPISVKITKYQIEKMFKRII